MTEGSIPAPLGSRPNERGERLIWLAPTLIESATLAARAVESRRGDPKIGGSVKYPIIQFTSLEAALKQLEPIVRKGQHLSTGRPFQKFGGMLPREAWANWLLCAAINVVDGRSLTFTSDPIGGDGLIMDSATGDAVAKTEHVMVRSRHGRSDTDLETLILQRVEKKLTKGEAYAKEKTLIIFLDEDVGNRAWFPNRVAQELPKPHHFKAVWVVSFEGVDEGDYVYQVVHLDVSEGNASVMRVRIAKDFASWTVTRVQ